MSSSSEPGGPEQSGTGPPEASPIAPLSLLKRSGRLLLRRPGCGLVAYAALATGLIASALLPGSGAALLGLSKTSTPLSTFSDLSLDASEVPGLLPTYSFTPPDYPGQSTGQALGKVVESVQQAPISRAAEMAPEVLLALSAWGAALLLAGPVVAGAYALALPCIRDGGTGLNDSSSEGPGSEGPGSEDLGSGSGDRPGETFPPTREPGRTATGGAGAGDTGFSLSTAASRAVASGLAYAAASLAMFAGLLLLVVPGAVLAAGLTPLMPLVAETGWGPGRAIRRAWKMTEGHRWQIFGLHLLVWGLATVAGGLASAFALGAESLGGPAATVGIGAGLLLGAGVGAWGLLARCCLYRQLRQLED